MNLQAIYQAASSAAAFAIIQHPAASYLLITCAINVAWDDATAYAEKHPKFAAFKRAAEKLGVSPKGAAIYVAHALGLAKGVDTPLTMQAQAYTNVDNQNKVPPAPDSSKLPEGLGKS